MPCLAVIGSSPRVRGKPSHRVMVEAEFRIIPARAGQTPPMRTITQSTTDHPRACGANLVACLGHHLLPGSSPRVRGKHRHRQWHRRQGRIIPARAGQTARPSNAPACPTDHPRACGANSSFQSDGTFEIGSSPRVRGKRDLVLVIVEERRIIPARAGQTEQRGNR